MSRHVSAEKWGAVFAGRVDERERGELDAHARDCEPCRRERARVRRASDTFSTLREQSAPEMPWDAVRTRVQWAVDKERREAARTGSQPAIPRRSRAPWVITAIAAAGVVALGVHHVATDAVPGDAVAFQPIPSPPAVPQSPATALAGVVVTTTGDGKTIALDGKLGADVMLHAITTSDVFATGNDNRIDVQFGPASAFALGPRSTLELRAFDERTVELRVDGTIDVDVGHRAPDQRFLVVAGEYTVEVRGTQFQVRRDTAGLTVACLHGRVVVRDKTSDIEVGAARRISIPAGAALHADAVEPLPVADLAALQAATPQRLATWTSPSAVIARRVTDNATARISDPPRKIASPRPDNALAVAARKRELSSGTDHARLATCTRSLAKSGLTDTFVQIELSVSTSGAVGYLNVLDTDLPSATAACVREVLADVRFTAGGAATWRERIDL